MLRDTLDWLVPPKEGDIRDKEEVLARLCKLTAKVSAKAFDCQEAADCVCEDWRSGSRFSPKVLDYIEQAVNAALERGDK